MPLAANELSRLALVMGGIGPANLIADAIPAPGQANTFANGIILTGTAGTVQLQGTISNSITIPNGLPFAFRLKSADAREFFTCGTVVNDSTLSLLGTGAATDRFSIFGVTPVVRAGPFTLTYSTSTHTHAAPTAASLTDNTLGTANTVLESMPDVDAASVDTSAAKLTDVNTRLQSVRNNFADLCAAVNALILDMAAVKQVVNGLVLDMRDYGLVSVA